MLINVGRGAPKLTGNATPADVIAGKTFYSNDARAKKIGSLVMPQIDPQGLTRYKRVTITVKKLSSSASAYIGFTVYQMWYVGIEYIGAPWNYTISITAEPGRSVDSPLSVVGGTLRTGTISGGGSATSCGFNFNNGNFSYGAGYQIEGYDYTVTFDVYGR